MLLVTFYARCLPCLHSECPEPMTEITISSHGSQGGAKRVTADYHSVSLDGEILPRKDSSAIVPVFESASDGLSLSRDASPQDTQRGSISSVNKSGWSIETSDLVHQSPIEQMGNEMTSFQLAQPTSDSILPDTQVKSMASQPSPRYLAYDNISSSLN